jgi:hypothetical protein
MLKNKTLESFLEEIEDIYFGSIAHKALQEEDEYITHAEVKKRLAKEHFSADKDSSYFDFPIE